MFAVQNLRTKKFLRGTPGRVWSWKSLADLKKDSFAGLLGWTSFSAAQNDINLAALPKVVGEGRLKGWIRPTYPGMKTAIVVPFPSVAIPALKPRFRVRANHSTKIIKGKR